MNEVRVVSLNGLARRLRDILGAESNLFHRFSRALRDQDEGLIQEVMDELALCPQPLRSQAHDAMLAWLFDSRDNSGLADLPAASRSMN
ncbi:MAG: hypothetical protein H6851_10165 [Geminicoccaceae bacterium]|nr:hypothetical protein [Geminicoccaceae bacterium]MCB9943971.1 hypothetical protein [Geminicoccaceae bacterium]